MHAPRSMIANVGTAAHLTAGKRAFAWLERLPPAAVVAATVGLAIALTVGDYVTGAYVAFTALYLVPVAIGSWFVSHRVGVALAAYCTLSWLVTDLLTRFPPVSVPTVFWNLSAQLAVFLAAAFLVNGLRLALVDERQALIAEHEKHLNVQRQLQHAERLGTVGRLAAGVAHELGTPLNVVGSYSQMIETRAIVDAEACDAARIIREQTESMTRIVRQLVDFARSSKPQRAQQNICDVVSVCLAMLKPLAAKKPVSLLSAMEGPLLVHVDSGQIQQVITNLVVNAIHAAPARGTVEIATAHASAQPPPDIGGEARECVVVRVTDDGRGIAEEVMPKLFEPFVTTKPIGEGTGLGLAVAFGIVREHGGWIDAENVPSGGARFTVYLPR